MPTTANITADDRAASSPRALPDGATADLAPVYALADHLDATLAMAEDLVKQSLDVAPLVAGDANAAIERRHRAISEFARTVRALELGITARLLQARARAIEVRHLHPRFEPFIALLIGGTAPLADAAAGRDRGLGDISATALLSGPDVLAFLTSRSLVEGTPLSLATMTTVNAGEDYLLAAAIHLGTLLDMIAQFLDSLELAFDLYAAPRKAE